MANRSNYALTTVLALTLLSPTFVLGQDQPTPPHPPMADPLQRWDYASLRAPSGRKIVVVTMSHPTHRIACRVRSFTVDQLACKRPFGKSRIYKPQEVAALIIPCDEDLRLRLVLGFNSALAAAIWGTVVLAPTCPPCAVGTGIAAFLFFSAAGATLIGDDQPDSLLYLAPGQTLNKKLGYVNT
jgi:hypothetical protein